MTDNSNQINLLHARLDSLAHKQAEISRGINELRLEISRLEQAASEKEQVKAAVPVAETSPNRWEERKEQTFRAVPAEPYVERPLTFTNQEDRPPRIKSDLEKFIGENLINKIGIVITVIGVAIGAKYSIDHDLISPLTRIILGYLFGIGLLGFGMRLKAKYENFSAVLVSGAMAIMYFITYAAYSFYHLIPQVPAFGLLVIFTIFTVVAALHYNLQVIAHIGLVGAYAVPFLLSEGKGNVAILFSYMAIINTGILVLSFKKYWKPLFYAAFIFTWLIYYTWYDKKYQVDEHFTLALIFLALFFGLFYTSFLAYKLIKKELFAKDDILLLLSNSFIFFGLGYSILSGESTGNQLLGLFTLTNAIFHFMVGVILYRQKLADRNLFYLVAGLVLVFITIAIPVQIDGNWVTLLWAGEATLLFWIGRTRGVPYYEKLSYPLMLLSFISLVQDWMTTYSSYYPPATDHWITPLFNIYFLSSLLFVAAFTFINLLGRNSKYPSATVPSTVFHNAVGLMIPSILLISIYFAFRLEIANYWHQLYVDSALEIKVAGQQYPDYFWNMDLLRYKSLWVINYSLVFFSMLTLINLKKIKSEKLAVVSLTLLACTVLIFLVQGLYDLSELRESYLHQTLKQYYQISAFNLWMRYVCFAFVALALFVCYRAIRNGSYRKELPLAYDAFLHISILWMLSSEWINLMDLVHSTQSYKIGLSILWGVYSLMLIGLGIWKKKKHLRIGAISLFALTLVKLFTYDISHLDTIAKTVLFVSLGILLLIISFLYNKYKHLISDEIKA